MVLLRYVVCFTLVFSVLLLLRLVFIFDFSVSYLKFKKPAALSVLETQNNQKHEKPKNKYIISAEH